jgi:hypothetical protein
MRVPSEIYCPEWRGMRNASVVRKARQIDPKKPFDFIRNAFAY